MYGDFAAVYDRLMADVDYEAWAAYYQELLAARGVAQGDLVLEAACGTGGLTLPLARRYNLLPSDQSEEMLSRAALKARDAGLQLPFVRQDMRRLSAHRPARALICGCDGVNYLLTRGDLEKFLHSARQALLPGGVIAFDLSSFYKLSKVLGQNTLGIREPDICYLWQNAWQPGKKKLSMALAIFVKEADGSWRLIEETQTQRAWEQEEITRALRGAGFDRIACYGDFTRAKPAKQAQRLHFAAIKA